MMMRFVSFVFEMGWSKRATWWRVDSAGWRRWSRGMRRQKRIVVVVVVVVVVIKISMHRTKSLIVENDVEMNFLMIIFVMRII